MTQRCTGRTVPIQKVRNPWERTRRSLSAIGHWRNGCAATARMTFPSQMGGYSEESTKANQPTWRRKTKGKAACW
jgi:hypothetical protein